MNLFTISAGGFSATVDGWAGSEREIWFLSMLGHQQSVRAIWARMVKGESGFLSGDTDEKSLPLAREAWGTWRFSGMRMPSGASYHGMLVPELADCADGCGHAPGAGTRLGGMCGWLRHTLRD